jgi:PAS domain S-box-containing protein
MPRLINSSLILLGVIPSLVGGVVLFGWYSNNASLIQVQPSFAPMQHNTALGFILAGLSLVFLNLKFLKVSSFSGLLVLLLGAITLFEYIFGVNIGLDELFIESYIDVKTSHPGRMAPNTALCFTLAGGILALGTRTSETEKKTFDAIEFIGAVVIGLGTVAFLGYLFELEYAYGWANLTRMAIHTSIGFIIVGTTLVLYVSKQREMSASPRFPIFIAISLMVISLSFWKALNVEQDNHTKKLIKSEVLNLESQLIYSLEQSILALERLKSRREKGLYANSVEWQEDITNYSSHKKEILAIELVDINYIVRQIMPIQGNEAATNLDLSLLEHRKSVLDNAKASGKTEITNMINLVQGGKGFLSALPIFVDQNFEGFILGVFDLNKLVDTFATANIFKAISVAFGNSENDIQTWVRLHNGFMQFKSSMNYRGVKFNAKYLVNPTLFGDEKSYYPTIIGCAGIILSLILAQLIYLKERSKFQSELQLREASEKALITKKLEASENYLEKVVEDLMDALVSIDTRGVINLINPEAERLFGYDSSELIGHNVSILMPEPDSSKHDNYIKNYLKTGESKIIGIGREVDARKKNGSLLPIHLSISQIVSDNEITFIGIVHDITERKKYERELNNYKNHLEELVDKRTSDLDSSRAQLAHADKLNSLGKLTASIAHEFNNPLQGVQMALELIGDDRHKKERQIQFKSLALRECTRMTDLILQLQNIYRPTSGKFAFVDINRTIGEVLLLCQKPILERGIQIQTKLDSNIPNFLVIEDQIKQVILNLIHNAEESIHDPKGKKLISISTKYVKSSLQIIIQDSGEGIIEDQLGQIFEPFHTTKSNASGTGLGLSVSYGIIENHGGKIDVASNIGEGTIFTVSIPNREIKS